MVTKIFIGCLVKADIEVEPPFCKVPFQGKDYMGLYLKSSFNPIKDLHEASSFLKKHLPLNGPIYIFPQSFLG